MPGGAADIRFGADCFSQHTDWESYLEAMVTAERLGYDSLWTPDHVLPTPPSSDPQGPILEPYIAIAAVAARTSRATLGLLVSPITFRNPALLTKMVTTLDHVSNGRAILGVGSGWAEEEHRQYGVEFGAGFGERLGWLRQALPVMRGMLDGARPSASGGRYTMAEVVNSPLPIQERLPILVGGGGPKVTLRLVAEYADMCNLIGSPELIAEREAALLRHCEEVGRDPSEIERSVAIRQPLIRDSRSEAEEALLGVFDHNGFEPWPGAGHAGTVEDIAELCAQYVDLGYRHLIFQFLAPYDRETMTRLIQDVRPLLLGAGT
jgi:alkanesulfonate monooxygenase SsuD/methylene tetrahydromethanopterin reductase-like flavin-dependent oxidoreductase (luciferase family)